MAPLSQRPRMFYVSWNQIFCSPLILSESLQLLLVRLAFKLFILQLLIVQVSIPQLKMVATLSSHPHTPLSPPSMLANVLHNTLQWLTSPALGFSQSTHKVQAITQAPLLGPSPKLPGKFTICTPSKPNITRPICFLGQYIEKT